MALNYTRAMQQELAELTDSVPWKWWAKYQKFDEPNARVEVADLFHFLISMPDGSAYKVPNHGAAFVMRNHLEVGTDPDQNSISGRVVSCAILHITQVEDLQTA